MRGKIQNILKRFLSLKIKTKFLISYMIIILFMTLTVGNLTYYVSKKIIRKNIVELSQQLLTQVSANIDTKSKEFKNLAFNVVKEMTANKIFNNNMKQDTSRIRPIVLKNIYDVISCFDLSNKYINLVCIKTYDSEYYWWEKQNLNKLNLQTVKSRMEYLENNFKRSSNTTLWVKSNNTSEIIFIKKMISPDTLKSYGIIAFYIDKKYFNSLNNQKSIINNKNMAIIDNNNKVLIYDDILKNNHLADDVIFGTGDITTIKHDKEKFIATKTTTTNDDWEVICFISEKELYKNADSLKLIVFITLLMSSLIAVGIAYFNASNVTKNITMLEKNMRKVEKGDFSIRIKPVSYDEIGLLALRFNYMAKKTNELINTVYKERLEKQKAEFEVLKAQINPHFLYNTLGSIKWYARMRGEVTIEEMVTALIALLKASINKSKYQTIEEEIIYIKNYIKLQKMRFEDRFNVEYEIDEEIKRCYILQFVLQPIVENAIYHGLEISKGNGLIIIRGKHEENNIKLEVEDNGVGMSQEMINKLLLNYGEKKYKGLNSIGIANVNNRIRLYFGEKYGIKINSIVSKGTKIEIIMPYITDADMEAENND